MEPPLSTVVYIARLTRTGSLWSAVVEGLPSARVTRADLVDLHDSLHELLVQIVDDDAVDVEYLTCRIPAGDPAANLLDLAPTPCFAA